MFRPIKIAVQASDPKTSVRPETMSSRRLSSRQLRVGLMATVAAIGLAFGAGAPAVAQDTFEILNVSYDATREFYGEHNALFNDWWTAQGNDPVIIR